MADVLPQVVDRLSALKDLHEQGIPHAGLQIYGGPGSLFHDFKIWPITFQGSGPSGPSGPILFSCEKSQFDKKYSPYSESTNSTKQKVHVHR